MPAQGKPDASGGEAASHPTLAGQAPNGKHAAKCRKRHHRKRHHGKRRHGKTANKAGKKRGRCHRKHSKHGKHGKR